MSTWDKTNNSFGHSLTALDTTKKKSGSYSGRIDDNYPRQWSKYVYSDTWTPINNSQDTYYTVSGWVYVEDVTTNGSLPNLAKLWIVTRKQGERGYPTGHISTSSTKEGTWEYLSKTVLIPADVKEINVRIENARLGKVWFDDVKIVKGNTSQTVIVEESNYYPFGLKHKGYNNVVSSNGNSVAQKFGYNGVEYEESLGLDLYEMDVRSYDPALGRFNGIDPVTHFSQGTSVAFDNNPIYFADPSGADAQSLIDEMLAKSGSGKTTWTNNNDGTFSGSNGSTATDEDHVTNTSKAEMETIAGDLNSIYGKKYGKTPFSVEKQTRTRRVKVKDGGWFGDDEYKEVEYEVYVLKGSMGFDWNSDKYTKMLYAIMTSPEDVKVDIVKDNGNLYRKLTKLTMNGLLKDYGGGKVVNSNHIIISSSLSLERSKSGNWTVGGVTLHELLSHISPNADPSEGMNVLRNFYGLKTGKNHPVGSNQNKKIK